MTNTRQRNFNSRRIHIAEVPGRRATSKAGWQNDRRSGTQNLSGGLSIFHHGAGKTWD